MTYQVTDLAGPRMHLQRDACSRGEDRYGKRQHGGLSAYDIGAINIATII